MGIAVHLIPVLKDNYVSIIRDESGAVAIIDPTEAEPVERFLRDMGWRPTLILNTHHHWDHTGGNEKLIQLYACPLVASKTDGARITRVTRFIADGEEIRFGQERIRALAVPGHTLGHTAFLFVNGGALFAGDTLFSMGCGRLFEGPAEMMWESLSKLMSLPDETQVYCGHEYTEANARFALEIEPDNPHILARQAEVRALRAKGRPTLPSSIGLEKKTNPFLRTAEPSVRARLGLARATDAEVFARLRAMKDVF